MPHFAASPEDGNPPKEQGRRDPAGRSAAETTETNGVRIRTPDEGGRGPLRIAMLSLHTSPLAQPGTGDAGGMNVYVRQVALALAERGARIEIFTRGPSTGPQAIADGVRVHQVPAGPAGPLPKESLPRYLPELAAAIAARCPSDVDLIHSHYWMSGLVGLDLAARWSVPLVHTMHTLAKVKRRLQSDADESDRRVAAETRLAREATRLTANTVEERDELVKYYGADAQRIDLVPPGVELEVFRPDGPRRWDFGPPAAGDRRPPAGNDGGAAPLVGNTGGKVLLAADDGGRAPLARNDGGRAVRLLFAGRIQKLKGPQILVRAVGQLSRTRPDLAVELVVLGARSGARELDLQRIAAEEGVTDRLRLLPPVPAPELAAWLRTADVVGVPSYSESFGLVALEAQACGTPVIAHDVGGLRHSVVDGSTGILVEGLDPVHWAHAIASLADDPGAAQALAQNAVVHAQGFSWTRSGDASLASYTRALAARAHGASVRRPAGPGSTA